jgi:signal transduction histidine kinase
VPVEVTVGPVEVPGRPMMALVCRDMTEAKDAAAALRRSAEIIDASPNLVGWTDRDGSLLFLNRAGRSMIGAGDEEVVDSWTAAGLVTKEAFEEATVSGSWHGETWLLLRNGIRLPVSQTVIAHTGDDGAVRFYSILATDLSERYELENMKDEFVSNVTHELRSPLTAVIGYLDLLKGGVFGTFDSEVIEVLTDVQTASNQMLELINDLLDLWRAEGRKVGDTVEMAVSDFVEAAVRTMLPVAAGKRVSVSVDVAPMITAGDRRQLERALLNVVGNAIKFTPADGDVKVKAELVDGKALIEVADTGVGIPPSEVEAVFERFYRASTAEKADIPGTGLGLPLVREVIRAHGGEAWIESTVGEGTRFFIELPTLTRPATRTLAESGVSG